VGVALYERMVYDKDGLLQNASFSTPLYCKTLTALARPGHPGVGGD